ncbi:unnamed protein product [Eruca vesicaria subsp. sativa]|uniref:Helicase ATP-binding domain-containing protein n=1 Tax=Eruca vesicaria subsp. sativa TaxID=29727 RepID=A0ABC8LR72_ERUVS|nr:unnamed protein product [Eruca vesicaria subsp. sativa]
MASSISLKPRNLLLSSFSTGRVLHLRRARFTHRPSSSSSYRRTLVAQSGFSQGPVYLNLIKEHAQNLLYTIGDETFNSVSGTTTTTTDQTSDWFTGIANYMETILKVLKDGLSVHVPYSYGFAIILLTVLVKAATFPLTKKQQLDYRLVQCQALVLAPTRELTQQIEKVMRALGDYLGVKVHACVGGTSVREDHRILQAGVHVVLGTPGRVFDMLKRQSLRADHIKMFVLDEADEMLSRGFKDQEGHPPLGWSETLAYLSPLGCSSSLSISPFRLCNPLSHK